MVNNVIDQQQIRQSDMEYSLARSNTILKVCKTMTEKQYDDLCNILYKYYCKLSSSFINVYYTAINSMSNDKKYADKAICTALDLTSKKTDVDIGCVCEVTDIYNNLIYVRYTAYYTKESLELDVTHKDLKDYIKIFVQLVLEMIEKNVAMANIEEMTNLLYNRH